MPTKSRRKAGYVKYEEVICPVRFSDGEPKLCRKEECAWYVEKVSRCSVWLMSYYLFKLAQKEEITEEQAGEES